MLHSVTSSLELSALHQHLPTVHHTNISWKSCWQSGGELGNCLELWLVVPALKPLSSSSTCFIYCEKLVCTKANWGRSWAGMSNSFQFRGLKPFHHNGVKSEKWSFYLEIANVLSQKVKSEYSLLLIFLKWSHQVVMCAVGLMVLQSSYKQDSNPSPHTQGQTSTQSNNNSGIYWWSMPKSRLKFNSSPDDYLPSNSL